MSTDAKFIPGLFFKPPNAGAPDFIIAKGSIKIADLIQFLQRQEGEWVNFDLKNSREGKPYAAIDDWKPQGGRMSAPPGRVGGPSRQNAPRPTSRPEPATLPRDGGWANDPDDDLPFISNRSHF